MENINIKINNKNYEYPKNVALDIIAKDLSNEYKGIVTIGKIKNKLKDLNSTLDKNCDLELIDTTQPDGMRVYMRTLSLIFIKACEEIFNGCKVTIEHSLSNGLYCEIKNNKSEVTEEDIEKIKAKVKSIIESDLKIEKIVTDKSEAIKILKNNNKNAKAELLKYKEYEDVKLYKCGGYINHFYGHMLPSTSYVKTFDIKKWQSGVVILGPSKENKNEPQNFVAQPKLSNIYKESEIWSELIGIDKVASLNEAIESKKYGEIISIVEALHEKKISQIADIIKENNKRVILIAAPSSSGKTSFAHRLSIQLKVNNLHPVPISLDDYFVDREDTPLDEFGNFDFESIYAIDLELFNSDLEKLLKGEEIKLPKFNFKTGKREFSGKTLKIEKDQPIILEGIHALNPMLTQSIDDKDKFKIYISVLTQINLDNHNRIPTTDLRLIRRIVRDYNFRGYSAEKTILNWWSVRRGEDKNIFPYQEEADIMFNSACLYELAVLKKYAKPLLEQIEDDNEAFIESNRILKFLQYFVELDDELDIPPTSIIREFIGGSRIVD
ncbi:phosphoribulokinase / Uridine kinase family protein [[Clostridium] bifermentans ATCC 638]|uniref:Phosphoribulokinase / Uridine kinase family protein n=2 Tax=Paraclostridium TaxID=1849822 RepID=T4VVF9_PARBF|nr:nucleoside kinase [Paraclostridium bifermentans]EQK44702.1 phosphoribulokinase / Uridine kinase family protein [[Clostridium] bifermentans ATCC 638] [Paraclostridium bifermentans ATCC 638 = DSM 14991]RIZ57827.1 AAA family ATPase [Paraclostridium bifermentans]UAG17898.1 nucleoside kinase [Paraclostridium bifermentans]